MLQGFPRHREGLKAVPLGPLVVEITTFPQVRGDFWPLCPNRHFALFQTLALWARECRCRSLLVSASTLSGIFRRLRSVVGGGLLRSEHTKSVWVGQPWRVVLRDLELDEQAILRRARQSRRLFEGDGSWVSVDDFYALFDAVEAEAGDPAVAVRGGTVLSAELFDPAYFAAICSPDLNAALTRLGEHMQLVGPFGLEVEVTADGTSVWYRCKHRPDVARGLGLSQLAFLVALARRATRHRIEPKRIVVAGSVD